MRIRIGKSSDVRALRELDTVSAEADRFNGKRCFVLRRKGVIEYFIKCRGLFVAEDNGAIIGYVLTHPVDWMHGVRRMIWVEHIGTHPIHRRKGVADALLVFVRKHYRNKGACLYAEIHPQNRNSIGLFRKSGAELVDRVLAFRKI